MLQALLNRAARFTFVVLALLSSGAVANAQVANDTPASGASGSPAPSEGNAPVIGQRVNHTVIAPNGRSVYFETWSGRPGQPVYLTFNGLLYNQKHWDTFLNELNQTGATIVRYAYSADPESLLTPSRPNAKNFSVEGLTDEVEAVLGALGLQKVTLLTLSFGSIGIEFAAKHPERVERLVMLSPMILPMDYYDLSGRATRQWLESIRAIWGEKAYELQWDLVMGPTVLTLVRTHIHGMEGYTPAGVPEEKVVSGAIEKIKATRHFDLRLYLKTALPRIDLILSEGEDNAMLRDQQDFWQKLNPSIKGNYVFIRGAGHALVGDAPKASAKALQTLLENDGSADKPFVNLEIDKDGAIVKQAPAVKATSSSFSN